MGFIARLQQGLQSAVYSSQEPMETQDGNRDDFSTTVDEPSWKVHLNKYLDHTQPDDVHRDCILQIASLVNQGGLQLLDVVKSMDNELTSIETSTRARATLFLAEVVGSLEEGILRQAASHLALFFSARLSDWGSARGALTGSLAVLRSCRTITAASAAGDEHPDLTPEITTLLAKTLLNDVDVQGHVQVDRMLCFDLFLCLIERHGGALAPVAEALCSGLVAALEGEKDPRCLLRAFQVWRALPTVFLPGSGGCEPSVLMLNAQDLCESIACYFPISFTPPPGDNRGITKELLCAGLNSALTATPLWAPTLIPHLAQHVQQESSHTPQVRVDSLELLESCAREYPWEALREHVALIWDGVRGELLLGALEQAPAKDQSLLRSQKASECVAVILRSTPPEELHSPSSLVSLILTDSAISDALAALEHADPTIETSADGSGDGSADVAATRCDALMSAAAILLQTVSAGSLESWDAVCTRMLARVLGLISRLLLPENEDKNAETSHGVLQVAALAGGARLLAAMFQGGSEAERVEPHKTSEVAMMRQCGDELSHTLCQLVSHVDEGVSTWGLKGVQALTAVPPGHSTLWPNCPVDMVSRLTHVILYPGSAFGSNKVVDRTDEVNGHFSERQQLATNILVEFQNMHASSAPDQPVKLSVKAFSGLCNTQTEHFATRSAALSALSQVIHSSSHSLRGFALGPLITFTLDSFARPPHQTDPLLLPACRVLTRALVDHKNGSSTDEEQKEGTRENVVAAVMSNEGQGDGKDVPLEDEEEMAARLATGMLDQMVKGGVTASVKESDSVVEARMQVIMAAVQRCCETVQTALGQKAAALILDPGMFDGEQSDGAYQWAACVLSSLKVDAEISNAPRVLNQLVFLATSSDTSSATCHAASSCVAALCNRWRSSLCLSTQASADDAIQMTIASILPLADGADLSKCNPVTLSKRLDLIRSLLQGLAMAGEAKVADLVVAVLEVINNLSGLEAEASGQTTDMNGHGYQEWVDVGRGAALALAAPLFSQESNASQSTNTNCNVNSTIMSPTAPMVQRVLYKQKHFVLQIPKILEAIQRSEQGKLTQGALHLAFAYLVLGAPSKVLQQDAERVLGMVVETLGRLSSADGFSDPNTLQALLEVITRNFLSNPLGRTAAEAHLGSLLHRLQALCQFWPLRSVRLMALSALNLLANCMPFPRLFPYLPAINTTLREALDDPKRVVRVEAAKTRQVFLAISTS